MRSSHRGAERLAELTREVGAVLSKVDAATRDVARGLNASSNPNVDGQAREFGPEDHEELCALASAMLIRLDQAIGYIKANGRQPQPVSPVKTEPPYLHLVNKSGA